jgi:hypothetical protein
MEEPANTLFDSMRNTDLGNWVRANPKWVNRL